MTITMVFAKDMLLVKGVLVVILASSITMILTCMIIITMPIHRLHPPPPIYQDLVRAVSSIFAVVCCVVLCFMRIAFAFES